MCFSFSVDEFAFSLLCVDDVVEEIVDETDLDEDMQAVARRSAAERMPATNGQSEPDAQGKNDLE